MLHACYYCLWNVIIACGKLLLHVVCYCCLWNVTIPCGMLLLLACGMLLLLVECYDRLWNVFIACGMLLSKFNVRDATPAGLAPPPPPTQTVPKTLTSMKIDEDL